jgi:hypothetical protein
MQRHQIREEIMAVAALLALGMLAIIPGTIAGSALTKSANQVPNVGTQASVATCAVVTHLTSGGWEAFGACMAGMWGGAAFYGALQAGARTPRQLVTALVTYVSRVNPWGFVAAVA